VLRLYALLICLPLAAQNSTLQIRIVEGEGIDYAGGSRATRGITVQVSDAGGKPVEGENVTFQLPADGPTGVFSNGSRMELAVTGADGRASVWGMRWNKVTGPLELRAVATKDESRASIACPLNLTEPEAKVARSHRKLWIVLAAVGGVAGVAIVKGGSSAAAASGGSGAVVSAPTFGAPTIAISHP